MYHKRKQRPNTRALAGLATGKGTAGDVSSLTIVMDTAAVTDLQAAINAATVGSTLDITGLTFAGAFKIPLSMTLRGGTIMESAGQTGLTVGGSDVTVDGVALSGGLNGIFADTVSNLTVHNCHIADMVYSGIGVFSGTGGSITGNTIQRIGVGQPALTNAYGIYLSRQNGTTLAAHPRTTGFVVSGNTVEDVPTWEGLDTHGGQGIQFLDNIVRRCRVGISAGPSYDPGGPAFAALDLLVDGDTVESGVTDGTAWEGIRVAGADAGIGSPVELATGTVSGNTITGYGHDGENDNGAIKVYSTSGLQITGNDIVEGSPRGIAFYYNNYSFTVSGNTITDPWSNINANAFGVYVNNDYETGSIVSNTFVRGSKSATHVLTENVHVVAGAHVSVTVT